MCVMLLCSSSEVQFKYIYFNHTNLAQKTSIHSGCAHRSANVPADILRLISDVNLDLSVYVLWWCCFILCRNLCLHCGRSNYLTFVWYDTLFHPLYHSWLAETSVTICDHHTDIWSVKLFTRKWLRLGICRRNCICRSSVIFVHPTHPIFYASHPLTSVQILQRSSKGTPPSGIKRKRGSQI